MRTARTQLWPVLPLLLGGCVAVDSKPRINEAADLVSQRLGTAPNWTLPWDTDPPAWDAGGVLSLDEAVARALRNNRALRADIEMIGQANADLVQAGLLQNPVFNFMVMFPDGGGLAMLRGNGSPMQPLQDLWLIPVRQDAARARLQEAVLRAADRGIEVATDVRRVYARTQYAQRAIELMRENITLADQSTEIIGARQVSGQATQVELNLARIRAQRLRSDLIAMESDFRSLQRELLLLMGFPSASDHWTVEPVHELSPIVLESDDERTLLQTGAEQRLDLLAAGWTLKGAAQQVLLERREALPDVALGFSFERAPRAGSSGGTSIPARVGNAGAQALAGRALGAAEGAPPLQPWQSSRNNFSWTLGPMIEIEIPVFDQNQAQIARAVHEYQQRLAEFEDRAQTVVRSIRESLLRTRQARDQAEFYRGSVLPDVQRNLELAQQSFIAGQEDLTVYLNTQEDVIMTRLRVLEFVRDYLVNRAELARAVGGRLPVRGLIPDEPAAPADLPVQVIALQPVTGSEDSR